MWKQRGFFAGKSLLMSGEERWTRRHVDARVTIVHPAARGLRSPGLVLNVLGIALATS